MARARNIKPSFFQNEELGELAPLERLAFIGMWTIADFKGCIEFRPKRLKVQILPYDECDFELIANNLEKSRFISTYSVQGQRYIKIINFEKHQNPHKNERESGSEIPDISFRDDLINKNNDLENIENNRDKNGTARADSLLLNPSTLIPDSLNPLTDSLIPDVGAENSAPTKNGTRLPADWLLPKSWGDWALAERPEFNEDQIRKIAELFKDHWIANANQAKAKKSDWEATWRNWVRNQKMATVTQFKSSGQQRIENTNKAVAEFLGVEEQSNVIEGEFNHA